MAPYVYLWEFTVAPDREARFLALYGPDGAWVQLFRTAPGFLDTRLLRAAASPRRYVTIDRWASAAAYQGFRRERAAEFEGRAVTRPLRSIHDAQAMRDST